MAASGKESTRQSGDTRAVDSTSGSGRAPGGGNGHLPGYSPWGCKESDMTESTGTHTKDTVIGLLINKISQDIEVWNFNIKV